jgi:xanthine dehydrogenase YagS FAD-binding subunit
MNPFAYDAAESEEHAIKSASLGGRFIAGGTTLIDLMREEVERPDWLIDINRLPLREISVTTDAIVIGALARMADVIAHRDVARAVPMLVEALVEGASPQLRNMASIGGNLLQRVRCPYFRTLDAACNKRTPGSGCAAIGGCNASHAILGTSEHCVAVHPSDLAVALVALDAVVHVRGTTGPRQFPVEELYRLPGETPHLEHTLERGELITAVEVPIGPSGPRGRYVKVRDRASYEFAVASAAITLDLDAGTVRQARIAVGGVATRPWRLRDSEATLVGAPATHEAWQRAAKLARDGARPLADNGYKVELLQRTIVRALEMTVESR